MEVDRRYVEQLKNDIVQSNLGLKSLIQDIYKCTGPLERLNEINADGRSRLTNLRTQIEELEVYGRERMVEEFIYDASNFMQQYLSTFSMFRKANVAAMLAIEKLEKEDLFKLRDTESILRHRQKKDRSNLVKMSSNVTDQLRSISRHLADTTQLSADTLSNLATSSSTVSGTGEELNETKSVITQSDRLLAKYSRRQFTDKIILLLGFAFFLACVFYVLRKRVFSW